MRYLVVSGKYITALTFSDYASQDFYEIIFFYELAPRVTFFNSGKVLTVILLACDFLINVSRPCTQNALNYAKV